MNASELIAELSDLITEHGDMPVYVMEDCEIGHSVEVDGVVYSTTIWNRPRWEDEGEQVEGFYLS